MFYHESEIVFTFTRSDGPGGQNVNKVNTKVTLRWNIIASANCPSAVKERFAKKFKNRLSDDGEVVISSTRFRSQIRNKADCLEKLNDMLEQVKSAPKKRKKTKPSKGAIEKRLNSKRLQADKKKDRSKKGWD